MERDFMATPFVADAVIAYMRGGNVPTDAEAALLDRIPVIDALRQRVLDDDVSWILNIIEKETGQAAGLACSLLRKHALRPDVKSCFDNRWGTANPYLKNRLMWRMLDDPQLPQVRHREFFEFVLANWDTFRDFNLEFYGRGAESFRNIRSRIEDPSFPASKKWIYLCCAPDAIEDRGEAKALVEQGLSMTDPFAREVAVTLLERFFPSEGKEMVNKK
jgi:hypothetical protein